MDLVHSQVPGPVQDGHSTGSGNRTHELLVQSQMQRPTVATPECRFQLAKHGWKELNPHTTASKAAGLPLADTRMCTKSKSAMSESIRPNQVGSLEPLPLGQWHNSSNTRRKKRESNSQGCYALSASNGVPSPIGLLFHMFQKAPEAGIEPATKRLTVALPYQHRTLRNESS